MSLADEYLKACPVYQSAQRKGCPHHDPIEVVEGHPSPVRWVVLALLVVLVVVTGALAA